VIEKRLNDCRRPFVLTTDQEVDQLPLVVFLFCSEVFFESVLVGDFKGCRLFFAVSLLH
jgi:hypothetical protein